MFDEAYRLAQLPLVAVDHPRVLAALPGQSYRRGRSEAPRHSLVLLVANEALTASSTFQAVERDLRARSVAAKIAWEMLPRRADKLARAR